MASEGCAVALWDLADASPVAAEIAKEFGVKAAAFQLDVTDCKAAGETAGKVREEFGKIDYGAGWGFG